MCNVHLNVDACKMHIVYMCVHVGVSVYLHVCAVCLLQYGNVCGTPVLVLCAEQECVIACRRGQETQS